MAGYTAVTAAGTWLAWMSAASPAGKFMPEQNHIVVFCNCSYSDIISDTVKTEVCIGLKDSGMDCLFIDDLCGAAALKNNSLDTIREYDKVSIVACFPRAAKWLLHAAGISLEGKDVQYFNMRNSDSKTILSAILGDEPSDNNDPVHDNIEKAANEEWLPWFPVIDYDRCSRCAQCFNFCLFGVYERNSDGTIRVVAPANCKTFCPACARICPEAAIMFPKISEEPINGSEISDEQSLKSQIKINVNEILGDDVYAALAERRKKARKNLLKSQDIEKAEQERAACSVNCKKDCEKNKPS